MDLARQVEVEVGRLTYPICKVADTLPMEDVFMVARDYEYTGSLIFQLTPARISKFDL